MAKKKTPKPPPTPKKESTCFRCDGTGELCNGCGESAAHCPDNCPDNCPDVDGGEVGYYECPDCKGTGK